MFVVAFPLNQWLQAKNEATKHMGKSMVFGVDFSKKTNPLVVVIMGILDQFEENYQDTAW